MWKLIPEDPAISAYVERNRTRPAVVRVKEKDVEIAASLEKG